MYLQKQNLETALLEILKILEILISLKLLFMWLQLESNNNHIVRKRTLNNLAKLLTILPFSTRPVLLHGWVFVYELSVCWIQISL